MTRGAEIGILANLKKLQMQDRIERGDFDRTNYRAVYDIYMIAYEDESLASRARERAARAYADAKTRKE